MSVRTRQEMATEGHECACHLNPPCDYCVAPVRCIEDDCDIEAEDYVDDDTMDYWLCPQHDAEAS